MRKRTKTPDTLGEYGILGDEQAAQLRSELNDLRVAVTDLSGRLHAQFTTIAAHAEIAREQADFARSEARADLDRTRDTLIELIEQLRNGTAGPTHHVTGTAPGPSNEVHGAKLEAIDAQLQQLDRNVDTCFARQSELADMVAAALDTLLAEPDGQPVSGLSLI